MKSTLIFSDYSDECVGKPCGTQCWGLTPNSGNTRLRPGICDNKTERCVLQPSYKDGSFFNPCLVPWYACEGKVCGERCLMGDLMYECDAKGACYGHNHICPGSMTSNIYNNKTTHKIFLARHFLTNG